MLTQRGAVIQEYCIVYLNYRQSVARNRHHNINTVLELQVGFMQVQTYRVSVRLEFVTEKGLT